MHYTYNENYFPQKGVPLHQNSKVKLKKGHDHADGWFIYTLLYI